jgi:hypothetical protein
MGMTLQEAVNDPSFRKLPPAEQEQALGVIDPSFKALAPEERSKVLTHLSSGQAKFTQGAPVAPEPAPVEEPNPWGVAAAKKGVRLAAAALTEGLVTTVGAPSDIAEMAVNGLAWLGERQLPPEQKIDPATGKPKDNTVDFPGGADELMKYVPDSLRIPKDLPPGQAILTDALKWQGAAMAPIAAATKFLTYADPNKVRQTELALAASGGVGAGLMKEIWGDGPMAEFVGGLSGSLGPQMVMKVFSKARQLVASATGLRTNESIEQEIGKEISKYATEEELTAGVKKSEEMKKELGDEFKPTTAQAVGTPGLIQSERVLSRATGEAADKSKRTLVQNQSMVRNYLEKGAPEGKLDDTVAALESTRTQETALLDAQLIRAQARIDEAKQKVSASTARIVQQADERATAAETRAQDRINALRSRGDGSEIRDGDVGRIIRQEYQKELDAFDTAAQEKYRTVDPDGRIPVPTAAVRDAVTQFTDKWGVSVQGLASTAVRKIQQVLPDLEKQGNDVASFKALHQARNEVRRLKRDALAAQDGQSVLQLGELDDALSQTLSGGGPVKLADIPPADLSERLAKSRSTLNVVDNQEILLRAEKAKADLEQAAGGGAGFTQDYDVGPGQGKKTTFASAHAQWYKDLTNPDTKSMGTVGSARKSTLKPEEVEGAIDRILQGNGADTGPVVAQVKQALLHDQEFAGSPWGRDFEKVAQGEPPSWLKLEAAPDISADEIKAAGKRLKDADEFYQKGFSRLKAGEAGALRAKEKTGRFRTHDEDVAAGFIEGETSIDDFIQAIGSRPAAREALREYMQLDFLRTAVRPDRDPNGGQVVEQAALRWINRHRDALDKFPELKDELGSVTAMQAMASRLRKEADGVSRNPEAVSRQRNPEVHAGLDEVTRRQTDLLDLRERTVGDWQKGLVGQLTGLDADKAAGAIVRSGKPRTLIADLNKRIGSDPDGQAGLTRALWDASLDQFSAKMTDAIGNPVLKEAKMKEFLRNNEEWMTERFGAERVARMQTSIQALSMLERTGRPVLPGGSDTFANLSNVLTDWGPFLSRINAVAAGRSSEHWLIGERALRIIGKIVKGKTEEAATELLDRAFYDPQVAQTFVLAHKNASEQLLEQRFRNYLLPKAYVVTDKTQEKP